MSDASESHKKRPHQYLLFELTKACQNDCVFCYNVWKEVDGYPAEELSTEDAFSVIDNVVDGTGCKYIALTGGEPLLNKGVFDIASYITSKGVTVVLITNGSLLTKTAVEKSIESGINYFEVSLHGHRPDVHDALVRCPGRFEEAIEAIINIKSAGGQVNTVFVATKNNINSFKEYVELNAILKVDWILFNRVACGGSCIDDWKSLAPSPMELERAFEIGVPLAEKYKIGLSAGVQIQPCLVDLSKYEKVATAFCPLNGHNSSHTYFAIDPAGNLRMCNRSTTILGNLLQKPFAAIVKNREVATFCKAVPDYCRSCKLGDVCAGGCKADALSYYGTLKKPDPYLELWKETAVKL